MNKQEALVEILSACRSYEHPHEETRRVSPGAVHDRVLDLARDLEVIVETGGEPDALYDRVREVLVQLAGGALYLLVDEVTVVTPDPEPGPIYLNSPGAAYTPTPVNGLATVVFPERIGD